ncbi:Holliday junction resolvase RuvX [Oleiagrimonas soli]|uniref:Putative pre-16S rRNA nuclease n=1 Tax=Oleiagrimonas soli TaxID=1543381 RepID=A0A099CYE4_9GAMM|nr:Holliday junction resolvase RuvX [Oleiagrimonas soli]KGI78622.1 Holliday junction resolvase [Oleiagrimonas soli]MBB6184081.1 putative Holliday junction resolvase [Oleiagrimonas soli]
MSCILGFDVGTRLIGVAVGNRLTATARALDVVAVRGGEPNWDKLDRLFREWQPEAVVVGLPLTLDGEEQPMTRTARAFANRLRKRYGLTPHLCDERNSSQEAARSFADARRAGARRRSDGQRIDADAAAVILERWLHGEDHD